MFELAQYALNCATSHNNQRKQEQQQETRFVKRPLFLDISVQIHKQLTSEFFHFYGGRRSVYLQIS